ERPGPGLRRVTMILYPRARDRPRFTWKPLSQTTRRRVFPIYPEILPDPHAKTSHGEAACMPEWPFAHSRPPPFLAVLAVICSEISAIARPQSPSGADVRCLLECHQTRTLWQ